MLNKTLRIKDKTFEWGTCTYLMGILNVTPDSFSGDGLLLSNAGQKVELKSIIRENVEHFVENGVEIIDVGGESTRPGAQPLSIQQELDRVIPVVEQIRSEFDVLVSIDTYHSQVAEAAITAGADIVNDVWGLHVDSELAQVAAKYRVPIILMHNRSSWAHAEIKEKLGGRYVGIPFDHLIEDIKRELMDSVAIAHQAGIPDERIILDPGIGFGKTVEQNLELVDRLGEIRSLGYPILYGPSRKSFIGYTLDRPVDQRIEGTAAAVAVGIVRGADIVRVHDVQFMSQVVRMADAITRRSTNH